VDEPTFEPNPSMVSEPLLNRNLKPFLLCQVSPMTRASNLYLISTWYHPKSIVCKIILDILLNPCTIFIWTNKPFNNELMVSLPTSTSRSPTCKVISLIWRIDNTTSKPIGSTSIKVRLTWSLTMWIWRWPINLNGFKRRKWKGGWYINSFYARGWAYRPINSRVIKNEWTYSCFSLGFFFFCFSYLSFWFYHFMR
jgi:hypothetical protein